MKYSLAQIVVSGIKLRTKDRAVKGRIATFACFFLAGGMYYAWATNTIALRNHLGLSGPDGDALFGLVATLIGLGAVVGCLLSGPLADRLGVTKVLIVIMFAYPLSLLPVALIPSSITVAVFGAILGCLRGAIDTVMNAHGVRVESMYGRPIMVAYHASYSLGGFIVGLAASGLANVYTDSPLIPYLAICGAMLLISIFASRWLVPDTPGQMQSQTNAVTNGCQPNIKVPRLLTLLAMCAFGVLALGAMLGEGTIGDWGAEFVSRERATTAAVAGAAVTLFTGAQFIGRLVGDRLNKAWGSKAFLIILGIITLLGFAVIAIPAPSVVTLAGFALVGLGISGINPLMLASAGRHDADRAGRNIGLVNSIGYSGFFIGPIFITMDVSGMGIAWMPLLPAVLIALVTIAGPFLVKTVPNHAKPSEEVTIALEK